MMNWMNAKFKNISFRVKIFFIIFIAILVPTVTAGTIIYIKSENAIRDQTSLTITNSMNLVIENIDSSLNAINDMSNSILTDNRLTSIVLAKRNLEYGDRVQTYSELRDLLSSFSGRIRNTVMMNGLVSYSLYIDSQKTVIDSKSTYFEDVNANEIDFVKRIKEGKDTGSWFLSTPFEENSILGFGRSRLIGTKQITYDNVLKDSGGNTQAILAINVTTNFISDNINKIQTGMLGEIVALDEDGNLVSQSDKNITDWKSDNYKKINNRITELAKRSGSFTYELGNESDFVIYSISEYTDWRYVVIIPTAQLWEQVFEIQKFLVLVISVSVLLVFLITYLLSYIFYKPLEKLVQAMQKIENRNLDARIDDKRNDEYHKVYKGFNDMVTELKSLINDLVNEKLLKKEADIKLLQAQINPHFLYNTLESIHSIAKIKKVDEISNMVSALAKFFRISLSGGKDVVTLQEAVNLILNYLTIQNIRFNGKIDYRIDIPEETTGYMVPKLILQPIVENSIYHGIEKKKGEGRLVISARRQGGNLLLSVEDNGAGISENELEELRKSIESDSFENSENFALKNLNRQIVLKYGPEFGVTISSVKGEGTLVDVRLPIVLERGG